jgi:simple sugar transport system permease protein
MIPMATIAVIVVLCLFIRFIVKTKLGQEFRAVGQDRHIAEVAGIKVDRVRIIAIIFSTVLAGLGQVIFLQNLGNINTIGSHVQVGTFAVAAILIGGASVKKATISQALLGDASFSLLFIVSPLAGKNLVGDAMIGNISGFL